MAEDVARITNVCLQDFPYRSFQWVVSGSIDRLLYHRLFIFDIRIFGERNFRPTFTLRKRYGYVVDLFLGLSEILRNKDVHIKRSCTVYFGLYRLFVLHYLWYGPIRTAAREPLSWSSRVQVALDAARGLEYIHEHTKPTYIHRDIKSANILLDKQFHAKVLVLISCI